MRKHIKVLVVTMIATLAITILPACSFAGILKAPKKTTIKSIALENGKVRLKWKKVKKCTGYKVYRKINGGKRKCIKTLKKKGKTSYIDNLPSFISGRIKYQVASYNRIREKKKFKVYKKLSSAKEVTVEATTEPIDPSVTEITESIYQEYAKADIDELNIDMVRNLMLYRVNEIRSQEGLSKVELDSYLNQTAQARVEEYAKTGLIENNTEYINRFNEKFTELTNGNEKYVRITSTNERRLEIPDEIQISVKELMYSWLEDNEWPNIRIQDQFGWETAKLLGVGYNGKYCSLGFAQETDYNRWN